MSLMEKLRDEREEGIAIGEARGRKNIIEQMLSAGIITPEQAKQFANA